MLRGLSRPHPARGAMRMWTDHTADVRCARRVVRRARLSHGWRQLLEGRLVGIQAANRSRLAAWLLTTRHAGWCATVARHAFYRLAATATTRQQRAALDVRAWLKALEAAFEKWTRAAVCHGVAMQRWQRLAHGWRRHCQVGGWLERAPRTPPGTGAKRRWQADYSALIAAACSTSIRHAPAMTSSLASR